MSRRQDISGRDLLSEKEAPERARGIHHEGKLKNYRKRTMSKGGGKTKEGGEREGKGYP